MNRREADAEAWERGEHPCQLHGHTASNDPQVAECLTCGTDLSIPPEERGETLTADLIIAGIADFLRQNPVAWDNFEAMRWTEPELTFAALHRNVDEFMGGQLSAKVPDPASFEWPLLLGMARGMALAIEPK